MGGDWVGKCVILGILGDRSGRRNEGRFGGDNHKMSVVLCSWSPRGSGTGHSKIFGGFGGDRDREFWSLAATISCLNPRPGKRCDSLAYAVFFVFFPRFPYLVPYVCLSLFASGCQGYRAPPLNIPYIVVCLHAPGKNNARWGGVRGRGERKGSQSLVLPRVSCFVLHQRNGDAALVPLVYT